MAGAARHLLTIDWGHCMQTLGGTRLARLFNERRRGGVPEAQLRNQFVQFVDLVCAALGSSEQVDFNAPTWDEVRNFLAEVSEQRARQGFTPVETAMFVFSLKEPLFARLRAGLAADPAPLAELTWTISTLFDAMGLYTQPFQGLSQDVPLRASLSRRAVL
jgi:rsbT co-antagonist protein RsbR